MHCYLSRDGVDPAEFIAASRKQLQAYDTVTLHDGAAIRAKAIDGGFDVAFADESNVLAVYVAARFFDGPASFSRLCGRFRLKC